MARRLLAAALGRVVKVEEGEGKALAWSCTYFFALLSSYYIIRPLRDTMGVSGGESALTWMYMGTLLGMVVANPIFTALVARFSRRVFIPAAYRALIACLAVFYVLLTTLEGDARLAVARVFFVWASVFNLFAVSVFWGFMADLWRTDQGKRLFGFIGMGGTLGAIAGAGITAALAPRLGPLLLLFAAMALLESAVFSVKRLLRIFGADSPDWVAAHEAEARAAGEVHAPAARPGAFTGLRLIATSPYLLGICLFLFCYSLSSTFLYFEQARIVRATFADAAARTAFFARIDLYVNLLSVVTQAFLSGRIISTLGVGATMALLPCLTMAGFAGLAAAPTAATLMLFQVVRRGAEYALVRPAREVLYTVVGREAKYSSKSFIDTFVYRGGDAIGAWTDRLLQVLGLGTAGIAGVFVPIAGVWAVTGLLLGRRQVALTRARDLRIRDAARGPLPPPAAEPASG